MSKPKKLIAISPEQYQVLMDRIDEVSNVKKPESAVEKKLSSLDEEMNEILHNDKLSEYEKMMAYSQAMQRYMEFLKQEQTSPETHAVITPSPPAQLIHENSKADDDDDKKKKVKKSKKTNQQLRNSKLNSRLG